MIMRNAVIFLACLLLLGGCETPGPNSPPVTPGPARPKARPTPSHALGSAARALVNQAHAQSASGDYVTAAATIERALRIEPDNPLLWIELGKVREAEGNHAQADAMARKALIVAGDDTRAQSAAWKLIAQSLRSRGRNAEAQEADRRAAQPVVR